MNMNSMYLVTNYSILVNDQQKVYILSTKVRMHDIEHFQNRYKNVQKLSEIIWKERNKTLTFKMYNWVNLVYTAMHATLCDHLGGYFLSLNCKSKYYTTGKGMWNSNILSVCTHLDTNLIFLFCKGSEKSITDDCMQNIPLWVEFLVKILILQMKYCCTTCWQITNYAQSLPCQEY